MKGDEKAIASAGIVSNNRVNIDTLGVLLNIYSISGNDGAITAKEKRVKLLANSNVILRRESDLVMALALDTTDIKLLHLINFLANYNPQRPEFVIHNRRCQIK